MFRSDAGIASDAPEKSNELSGLLGRLQRVRDVLKLVVDIAEGIFKHGGDQKNLVDKLNQQLSFIQKNTKLVDTELGPSCSAIQDLTKSLEAYSSKLDELQNTFERIERKKEHGFEESFHTTMSTDKDQEEIEDRARQLDKAFLIFMDLVTFFVAEQTVKLLDRQALNQLQYVNGAQGNQHRRCLEGTRTLIIHEIDQWASKEDAKPIFALIDQAGTGKSTISTSMAQQWDKEHSLLSRFFFSRSKGITSGEKVASTLAGDMATTIPLLRSLIIKTLEENPNISGYAISKKLDLFVFAPLKFLREENNNALSQMHQAIGKQARIQAADLEKWHDNIQGRMTLYNLKKAYTDVLEWRGTKAEAAYRTYLKELETALTASPIIILDAIDECSEDDRTKILHSFLQCIAAFPNGTAPFKLYFTSRPDEDIVSLLQGFANVQRPTVSLHSSDVSSNHHDIELYAQSRLKDKLDPQQISSFAAKADGLFIWASTAATLLLEAHDVASFNERVISNPEKQPLDYLYDSIVDEACNRVGKNERRRLLEILQLFCVAREPLTVRTMDELLALSSRPGSSISGAFVAVLGSVISEGSNGKPVQALHASFIEYLLRNQRSPRFPVLSKDANVLITQGCFAILLTKKPRQNAFSVIKPGLVTPNNDEIKDLEQRIQRDVSPGLRYAAIYGMLHMADCIDHEDVIKQLRLFFETRLLSWIELMSYLGKVPNIIHSIQVLGARLKDVTDHVNDALAKEIDEWCDEILRMIQSFEAVITRSAQQVYHSALASVPSESKIYRHYHEMIGINTLVLLS